MEARLEAAVRKVVDFLTAHGYRYAIIGGIALSQWGIVRATFDADIKVLVPNYDYATARAELRAAFPQPARPEGPENPLIVDVLVEGVTVDLLLALPGYEELIIQRAIQRDLGGWSVQICSAEDLIIQKVVAGREKDWLDVEALLIEQRGHLDEAYIQEWLSQFTEALENPEILARYQQVLSKAKGF